MKIHFKAAECTHNLVQEYTLPQVYVIKNGPADSYELWTNDGYAHTWIMEPVSKNLGCWSS
ncbi:MAG: hypothetical protein ABGY95_09120 [Rubritalea sp.]|uniref:hypothetical protein n=1 Tax=Rubritalea sp. TaxID=2109375 RepID=UPI003241F3B5